MTVNSYLTYLSTQAILRDQEKESIAKSISFLKLRLHLFFHGAISNDFVFGSYSRGTILSRSMDADSDVDYMVVFKDTQYRPQTYLDRLRRFAETHYARSEIEQSNPTIVLTLNHIRFELVPAIDSFLYGLQIPAKASDYQDWIQTDPKGFNDKLTKANQANNNFVKPLVRIMKYWNARADHPFASYELEQKLAGLNYGTSSLFVNIPPTQLSQCFYRAVDALETGFFDPQ